MLQHCHHQASPAIIQNSLYRRILSHLKSKSEKIEILNSTIEAIINAQLPFLERCIFFILNLRHSDIYEQYGALHSIVIFLAPMNISLIRIKSLNYLRKPRADFLLCYSVKEYESELFTLHLQWQGVNDICWMKYLIINWKLNIEKFWTNFLSWLNFIMTTIPIEN